MNARLRFEHMLPIGSALLGLCLAGPARAEAGRTCREPKAFWIELCDATGLESSILRAARDEAATLFAQAAVSLSWEMRCDTPPPTKASSARIYVVARLPQPIRYELASKHGKTNLMGYVLTAPGGTPGSVIYVERPAIELNASRFGRESLTESRFARALGRVIAHELAHRFLRSGHTRDGILKDPFNHGDLTADDRTGLFFTSEQVGSLHQVFGCALSK